MTPSLSAFWQAVTDLDPKALEKALTEQPDLTARSAKGFTALEVALLDAASEDQLQLSGSVYVDERWWVIRCLLRAGAPVQVPPDRNGTSLFRHALSTHVGEFLDGDVAQTHTCLGRVAVWLERVAREVPTAQWSADLADAWADIVAFEVMSEAKNVALAEGLVQLAIAHGAEAQAFRNVGIEADTSDLPIFTAWVRQQQATTPPFPSAPSRRMRRS